MASSVKDRLVEYLSSQKISKSEFGRTIGVSNAYVTSIRKSIDSDKIKSIALNYPNLNIEWLLTGEGSMIKSSGEMRKPMTSTEFSLGTDHKLSSQDIPLYDLSASAGLVSIFNDLHQNPEDYLRVPNLPPVDGAVYVRGDSMSPLLKSGDIIIFKKMELSLESILWGQIYLLSFDAGGDTFTVVKYVHKADKQDYLRLVSHNVHYEPKDIPVSSIRALAIVKASLTFHTME